MASVGELTFDRDQLHAYMHAAWPEAANSFSPDRFDEFRPSFCRMRHVVSEEDVRPGGTVSGPTLMRLADTATYAIILGHLGAAALAVTTSLSIEFLRRPVGPTIVADCDLVKLGRSLAVCRVAMASADVGSEPNMTTPEAIANVTYSLSLVS